MLMSGIVMPDEHGQPAYLATVAIDLTDHFNERQQSEKLLVSAKEEAENASRVKSEFLANMSHEIRTPLNAIIGLSELQIAESLPERSHHRAREIYQSGELLLGIVNDLLDFSEIESKTLAIKADFFRLSDVIS
jgi:signal transduction histidine kinase